MVGGVRLEEPVDSGACAIEVERPGAGEEGAHRVLVEHALVEPSAQQGNERIVCRYTRAVVAPIGPGRLEEALGAAFVDQMSEPVGGGRLVGGSRRFGLLGPGRGSAMALDGERRAALGEGAVVMYLDLVELLGVVV